jgi:hypothetical protein
MAKKKKTKATSASIKTGPMSGKELYQASLDLPPPKPVEKVLPPIEVPKTYKTIPEDNNDVLLEHLHAIDIRGEVDVPEFRDYTNTGDIAVNILRGYVASGLCVEKRKNARSYFSLTPKGQELLS